MEMLAKTVALRLSAMAFDESKRYQRRVRDLLPLLGGPAGLAQSASPVLSMPALQQEVLGLVHASAALIATGDELTAIGPAPDPEYWPALLQWLRPQLILRQTYATHALAQDYPPAVAFARQASGLLAIRLDPSARHCLLWFREEVIQSTTWAGEADKQLVQDEIGPGSHHAARSRAGFRRGAARRNTGVTPKRGCTSAFIDFGQVFLRQQLKVADESRRLAASVYENSSEAMVVTDANNVILNINPAFTALTGYRPAEVIGQTPMVLKSGRHDARFYQDMWLGHAPSAWCLEWRDLEPAQKRRGLPRVADHQQHLRRRRKAAPASGFVHRHFRTQNGLEMALHASEARFRGVFERAYIGISITDLEGRVLEANHSLARILGYPRHELLGLNVAEFTHPDDQVLEALHVAELMSGKRDAFRMEKRYLTRSKGQVWIDLLVTVIRDANNEINAVIRLVIDISDRLRAEADLRIAATAFESHEGMMVTNSKGLILRVNHAFTQITGWRADEVVNQNPRILKSGKHDAAFYADMWQRIHQTGSWQADVWNRRKNGEQFYCWLSITAVKSAEGPVSHYVGTLTDLTERKAAADKIELLAFYDHLTQLPNRRLMMDRLQQAIVNAQRRQRPGAVLLLDLDNFKSLNDTRGHAAGDLLLVDVAKRLQHSARAGDSVARIGGDEFIVIIEDLGGGDLAALQAEAVGEKFLKASDTPLNWL